MNTNTNQDYDEVMTGRYFMDKIEESKLILEGKTRLMATQAHLAALMWHIHGLNERIAQLEKENEFKGEGDIN